jgi:hypothetical protein
MFALYTAQRQNIMLCYCVGSPDTNNSIICRNYSRQQWKAHIIPYVTFFMNTYCYVQLTTVSQGVTTLMFLTSQQQYTYQTASHITDCSRPHRCAACDSSPLHCDAMLFTRSQHLEALCCLHLPGSDIKGKGVGHPRTGHRAQRWSKGIGVLFL